MTVAVADLLTLPSDACPTTDADCATPSRDSADVRVLVDAARAGSAEAFGRLVALHERVVFRAALAALGSPADAEDAAQDAFVVAWRKLGGFRGETPGPEARAVARDEARRVRAEIRRLSPRLRDTLLLAASGEHTYDEIARMLGIPLGTVKWRVAEARRILAARCGGRTS